MYSKYYCQYTTHFLICCDRFVDLDGTHFRRFIFLLSQFATLALLLV